MNTDRLRVFFSTAEWQSLVNAVNGAANSDPVVRSAVQRILKAQERQAAHGLPLEQRFWRKVSRENDNECWEWQAGKQDGYGAFKFPAPQNAELAHRASWFFTYGEWPQGVLHHVCENRGCVNPWHLQDLEFGEHSRLTQQLIRVRNPNFRCGHERTSTNVIRRSDGSLRCRPCTLANQRKNYRRRKQRQAA